jgi:xylan 1,4-beta-xylosidase
MKFIENPILAGFNPDPSILRVGDEYYIATSTFEWWPGVQIHYSRDLRNWKLLVQPLKRDSQLDLHGVSNSGGVWAPDLSHDGTQFRLVYTNVKYWAKDAPFSDTLNFMVTAERITGPWSDPVFLNSSGFDPSLFHDDIHHGGTGQEWLLNMRRDHRLDRNVFSGILLQEFDAERAALVGLPTLIFKGTSLGVTEGPHLYKRNWNGAWWYYLVVAEGGTEYEHAVTVCRSEFLKGPYEVHPDNPLLTSKHEPTLALQKAGHASFVETQTGDWYLAHLCARPLEPPGASNRHCNLGRETALQRLVWGVDGWPRIAHGKNTPTVSVPAPELPDNVFERDSTRDDFDRPELSNYYQSLRTPVNPNWLSLTARPGYLRMYGRESLNSRHQQSLIGRRLQSFRATAETCVEFAPESFQQMAGLACFYDTRNWVYLRVSRDENLGKSLAILMSDNGRYDEPMDGEICVEGSPWTFLRVEFEQAVFRFRYSRDARTWSDIGPVFPSANLSDEHCGGLAFTGTFLALCVQDLSGARLPADFDYFEYEER